MGGVIFDGQPWQGRPRGGYWLPREFNDWPEVAALSLEAAGMFFRSGIWAARVGATSIGSWFVTAGARPVYVRELVEARLWTPAEDREFRIKSMAELRSGRGRPGLIMKVSRLMPDCPQSIRAGHAALGLWARAAAWSLTSETPGYIPTPEALRLGGEDEIGALFDVGLWRVLEHGFTLSKGDHPIEAIWALTRDDDRAEIDPELRRRVLERDGGCCVECGALDDLTLDHIIPWIYGGPDTYENLRVLCRSCNSRKGARI